VSVLESDKLVMTSLQLRAVAGVDPSLDGTRGFAPTFIQLEPTQSGTSVVEYAKRVAVGMMCPLLLIAVAEVCPLPFLTCSGSPCQKHYSYELLVEVGAERLEPATYTNEIPG
jgi:hypothetical protein